MYYLSENKKGTSKKARTSENIFLNEKHNKSENPTEKEANDFGQDKWNAYTLHWKKVTLLKDYLSFFTLFQWAIVYVQIMVLKKHFILKYF